jgi:hypothetical protein
LALLSWGFAYSVKVDASDAALDDAIDRVIAQRPATLCSCGHEHDPTELHVREPACAHDGTGTDCAHDCETCALAALRPSPTTPRADRADRAAKPS